MHKDLKYNTPQHFDNLYKILTSNRFLNKEGLGGELPFFIHSYPISKQKEVEPNILSLVKRLEGANIEVLNINLYILCIDILHKENLLDQIISQEKTLPKQRLVRVLSGPLNVDTIIIPEIQKLISVSSAKIMFITGVGEVFPIVRSHTILNNLQAIIGDLPVVMFFPGTYNNQSLVLFDRLKDDNYYRAHNINEYKI